MVEKSTKEYSKKQEKMIADELGGYPVGLSGAGPANPGDVRTYDWLVECKTHTAPGHSIFFDIDVWKKIESESLGIHRKTVLVVDDGSQLAENTWCLCRSNNLKLTTSVSIELPVKIRKNITCSNVKLSEALTKATKQYVGTFYENAIFEANWNNESVAIMPLHTFKELFEK